MKASTQAMAPDSVMSSELKCEATLHIGAQQVASVERAEPDQENKQANQDDRGRGQAGRLRNTLCGASRGVSRGHGTTHTSPGKGSGGRLACAHDDRFSGLRGVAIGAH